MDEQPTTPEPTAPTPAAPPPTDDSARSGGGLRLALFVAAAVFALAGVGLAIYGFMQSTDASDIQDEADAAGEELRAFEQREDEAKSDLGDLSDAAAGLLDGFDELTSASLQVEDAANAEVDAANAAIDQYNAFNDAAAVSMFENEVGAAIADLETAINERQEALEAAQAIVDTIAGEQ